MTVEAAGVLEVPVDSIRPNLRQPRQAIQPEQLGAAASMRRARGVAAAGRHPLGRRHVHADRRGERWRAARVAGLERVPAIIKEATPSEMLELALVENLQRADLNPLEEAHAYQALVEEFGLTQEDVADRVGKSRITVTNALQAPEAAIARSGVARAGAYHSGTRGGPCCRCPPKKGQLRLLELAVADGLNVRQVELARRMAEAANREQAPEKPARSDRQDDLYDAVRELEDRFRNALGTKVQLSRSSRGGKLVIYFYLGRGA